MPALVCSSCEPRSCPAYLCLTPLDGLISGLSHLSPDLSQQLSTALLASDLSTPIRSPMLGQSDSSRMKATQLGITRLEPEPNVTLEVAPSLRSWSCLVFPRTKIHPSGLQHFKKCIKSAKLLQYLGTNWRW